MELRLLSLDTIVSATVAAGKNSTQSGELALQNPISILRSGWRGCVPRLRRLRLGSLLGLLHSLVLAGKCLNIPEQQLLVRPLASSRPNQPHPLELS